MQKAAKQQAVRNSTILKRLHLISLVINVLYIASRFLVFLPSSTRATYLLYIVFSIPAIAIEIWLEKIARPTYGPNGELQKPGEDLEAKGLIEYMCDVLYWTWGTVFLASVFGDKAWWLWTVVPSYSIWLAYSMFGSARQGVADLTGQGLEESNANQTGTSNRRKKMEKRGQKMQYR